MKVRRIIEKLYSEKIFLDIFLVSRWNIAKTKCESFSEAWHVPTLYE